MKSVSPAILPIAWLSFLMHHRENHDLISRKAVNEGVWETITETSLRPIGVFGPAFGKPDNSSDCGENLLGKRFAETRFAFFVKIDCLLEFRLGFVMK